MSSTLSENVIRLTSRRDHDRFVPPAADLAAARDGRTWPVFEILEPGVHTEPAPCTAVTSYADVRAMLSHEDIVNGQAVFNVAGSRAKQPGNLLYKDGEEHRRLRLVLLRHFTVKRVAALRPQVDAIVDSLIDDVEAAGPSLDLVPMFTRPMPALVFCALMGVPYGEHADVLGWTDTLLDLKATPAENHKAVASVRDWVAELVSKRVSEPGDDLMSALLAGAGENLSVEEAIGMGSVLMGAGIDTTSHSTALSIFTLLSDPGQMAAFREIGGLTDRNVDEMLRYLSPVPAAQLRAARDKVVVGDNAVGPGTSVMLSLLAANHDASFVADPGLDLRRGRTNHVAFGYGRHQCPGQHLARLEMTVAVTRLLQRFPDMRLAADPQDLGWYKHNLIYGVRSLPVELNR